MLHRMSDEKLEELWEEYRRGPPLVSIPRAKKDGGTDEKDADHED